MPKDTQLSGSRQGFLPWVFFQISDREAGSIYFHMTETEAQTAELEVLVSMI